MAIPREGRKTPIEFRNGALSKMRKAHVPVTPESLPSLTRHSHYRLADELAQGSPARLRKVCSDRYKYYSTVKKPIYRAHGTSALQKKHLTRLQIDKIRESTSPSPGPIERHMHAYPFYEARIVYRDIQDAGTIHYTYIPQSLADSFSTAPRP